MTELRRIRSYVRLEGRLTQAQSDAIARLWPRFGLELGPDRFDFARIFGREAPLFLEIGFGNGEALAQLATNAPERDFVGIEVHRPGVGHLLRLLEGKEITNVRVLCEDAALVLREHVSSASLDGVLLWFPDPWPKKRHHKRRLVHAEFIALLRERMRPGGYLHLATDWQHYAQHMLATVDADGGFVNLAGNGRYPARLVSRPLTKFEQRGLWLGHEVWDMVYRRV
ncbi:MAG: tRNA (guanosine(46)-N7)-methyltransferase TrmB [Gammaproteobacteria bacterium]|nr:tRNA (guanosine(46)-N7)-methyltransferase TrmB [Gammaproteobacteria bacterium]